MQKRKSILFLLLLVAVLIMGACNNSSANESENYPNDSINLIVAYSAGGGTDTGARILQPYLEKELGVSVNIINKPGGAGWVGWGELASSEPDGYTLGYINSPNITTGYLDPKLDRKENLDNFQLIANHVLDPGVVAIQAGEERFSNFEEMIAYAQKNELTATTSGVGSNDHMAILKMNEHYNTKITPIHTAGAAEGSTQVLGGHVDLFVAKVGEATTLHNNKELKAVAVMTEERSPFMEEVPTTAELGFPEITSQSARGIAAPSGLSDEKLEILNTAFKNAIENAEQVEKMGTQGLEVLHLGPEEYKEMLLKIEDEVKGLSDLLGY